MKKIRVVLIVFLTIFFSCNMDAFADLLDKDAEPVPVVASGSFTCDTWIHTSMDNFNLSGGALIGASWSFSRGYVGYNLNGSFVPGETLTFSIAGTMGKMDYQMDHKGNDLFMHLKCYDASGSEIKSLTQTVQVDDSMNGTLSDVVSLQIPEDVKTVQLYGSFTCSWSTPYATASEMVAVKVDLTSQGPVVSTETTTEAPVEPTTSKKNEKQVPEEAYCILGDAYGEVNVRPNDEDDDAYIFAEIGMYLFHNDRIKTLTRSGAIISFADMTTFVMKEDTTIVLDIANQRESKIALLAGRMWTNFKSMVEKGTIEVEMSQAVAGIKGTTFICEENNGISTLKVFEGTVEFTSKATGEMVLISDGQMVSADQRGLSEVEKFDVKYEIATWNDYVKESMDDILKDKNDKNKDLIMPVVITFVLIVIIGIFFTVHMKKKKVGIEKHKNIISTEDTHLQQKYCVNCGQAIDEHSKFCSNCGEPLH
ncbi:MAG: FecR domain-containing protein [Clostridia bacterium]|nr:FecR domain-containing protein [Clostridia bacterium]